MSEHIGINYFINNSNKIFCYYRLKLNDKGQKIYDKIRIGLLSYSKMIELYDVSEDEIQDIFQKIVDDNPNLFYVEQLVFEKHIFSNKYVVTPQYRFDIKKANDTLIALMQKCKQILQNIFKLSQFEQEKYIHDYFIKEVVYDNDFATSSFECVGPLLFGKGVCEGISKAAKLLFDFVGIKSLVLHGYTNNTGLNFVRKDELHAWNIVLIENKYYHLDITFDLTLTERGTIRYDYFNLSYLDISTDHSITTKGVVMCNDRYDYYRSNNLYLRSQYEYEEKLKQTLSDGKTDLVIKLAPVNNAKTLHARLMEHTSKILGDLGYNKTFYITCNETRYIYHFYLD